MPSRSTSAEALPAHCCRVSRRASSISRPPPISELIKYKAYQIAPDELEAVLVSHPAVSEAAVIPSPDEEHGEVPKAFVVLRSAATPDELMAFVAARVASYKKVRKLVVVDAIPKSPAGKLLRRVLVEQERSALR